MKRRIFAPLLILVFLWGMGRELDAGWKYKAEGAVVSVSLDENGYYPVAGYDEGSVYFLDRGGQRLGEFKAKKPVQSISVNKDGSIAAVLSEDRLYLLMRRGKELWSSSLKGSLSPPAKVNLSKDGSGIVVYSSAPEVFYYNRSGRLRWKYRAEGGVSGVELNAKGDYIVIASRKGNLYFLSQQGYVRWKKKFSSPITSLAISSDGTCIAAGLESGEIYLFNRGGVRIRNFKFKGSVEALNLTPRGRYLAGGDKRGTVFFSSLRGKPWTRKLKSPVRQVFLSPYGEYIVVGTKGNFIAVFDSRGRLFKEIDSDSPISQVALSRNGHWLLFGTSGGYVHFSRIP